MPKARYLLKRGQNITLSMGLVAPTSDRLTTKSCETKRRRRFARREGSKLSFVVAVRLGHAGFAFPSAKMLYTDGTNTNNVRPLRLAWSSTIHWPLHVGSQACRARCQGVVGRSTLDYRRPKRAYQSFMIKSLKRVPSDSAADDIEAWTL